MTETPGTQLHTAWRDVAAPEVAVKYWRMPEDAMWVDCLKRMLADESHHRDVNHAMASMSHAEMFGQDNPFIHEHQADFEVNVRRRTEAVLKQALGSLGEQKTKTTERRQLLSRAWSMYMLAGCT